MNLKIKITNRQRYGLPIQLSEQGKSEESYKLPALGTFNLTLSEEQLNYVKTKYKNDILIERFVNPSIQKAKEVSKLPSVPSIPPVNN